MTDNTGKKKTKSTFMKAHGIVRLGRDGEMRYSKNGDALVTFSAAADQGFGESMGTGWWDFEWWGKRAEAVSQYLVKGAKVYVEGRLEMDNWVDRDSGQRRSKPKIVITDLQIEDYARDRQTEAGDDPFAPGPAQDDDEEINIPVA